MKIDQNKVIHSDPEYRIWGVPIKNEKQRKIMMITGTIATICGIIGIFGFFILISFLVQYFM